MVLQTTVVLQLNISTTDTLEQKKEAVVEREVAVSGGSTAFETIFRN